MRGSWREIEKEADKVKIVALDRQKGIGRLGHQIHQLTLGEVREQQGRRILKGKDVGRRHRRNAPSPLRPTELRPRSHLRQTPRRWIGDQTGPDRRINRSACLLRRLVSTFGRGGGWGRIRVILCRGARADQGTDDCNQCSPRSTCSPPPPPRDRSLMTVRLQDLSRQATGRCARNSHDDHYSRIENQAGMHPPCAGLDRA